MTIAKGSHLFPYRTQQLSPSAPMVLGGQPPGRVGRCDFKCSKVAQWWSNRLLTGRLEVRALSLEPFICRGGGTGRRTGLKILRSFKIVPVRFRSSAPYKHRGVEQLAARRAHNPKVVGSSPAPATNKIGKSCCTHHNYNKSILLPATSMLTFKQINVIILFWPKRRQR